MESTNHVGENIPNIKPSEELSATLMMVQLVAICFINNYAPHITIHATLKISHYATPNSMLSTILGKINITSININTIV